MCFSSHETTAYAKWMDSGEDEAEEVRDFKRACQSGPGTARYDSASWNSVELSEAGEAESESGSDSDSEVERKLRSGVKS